MANEERGDPQNPSRDSEQVPQTLEVEASPAELLSTLARLDLEAALAHEAAAELSPADDVRRQLVAFAQDHRRHAAELNGVLARAGEPTIPEPAEERAVLAGLLRLAGPIGNDVVVVALLADEQLTNLSYDAAVAYEWDDDVARTIEAFGADEQRHLSWLARRHDELAGHAHGSDQPGSAE